MSGKFYGRLRPQHPLEAARLMIVESDVPSSYIDLTTFNPDTDTAISHFVVSTAWFYGSTDDDNEPPLMISTAVVPSDPITADGALSTTEDPLARNFLGQTVYLDRRESIESLARGCDGSILEGEDGKLYFKRFDPTAATVATWGADQIVSISQTSGYDDLINEVRCKLGSGSLERLYVRRDDQSQSDFAPPDGSEWIRSYDLDLPFALSRLMWESSYSSTEATDGVLTLFPIAALPITGTRIDSAYVEKVTAPAPGSPMPQNAAAKVSASRPMYIQYRGEVIKVTGAHTGLLATASAIEDVDTYGRDSGTESYWPANEAQLNGVTRAHEGTADAISNQSWAFHPTHDITMLHYVANSILTRAANGIPRLQVETTFSEIGAQIGDLVELDSSLFAWFGFDGTDPTNIIKFEITGKSIDPLGERPPMFDLAFASVATTPWTPDINGDPVEALDYPGYFGEVGGEFYDASGTQTVAKSVSTPLSFDTTDTNHLPGWDDATDQFTAFYESFYEIEASAEFADVDPGAFCKLDIYVDSGSGFALAREGEGMRNDSAGSLDIIAKIATTIHLQAGDIMEIRAFHSSSLTLTINAGREKTYLVIRRV
jgi:hypothetical protein